MKINVKEIERKMMVNGMCLTIYTDDCESVENFFQQNHKELEVDIHEKRKKRSINANSYAWLLLNEIAKNLLTTSVEVYKEIVKEVGPYEPMVVPKEGLETFRKVWESNGYGWVTTIEQVRGNNVYLRAYFGSSTYDSKQMARLIDEIVREAKQLGIETLTPNQLEEMKQAWREQ